ncbi:MAG: hypothetical protein RL363_931, partial [Bacteroidota bacterium]
MLLISPIIGLAQDINTNNLTTINYVDTALIKKHYKKVDTSRITIEF